MQINKTENIQQFGHGYALLLPFADVREDTTDPVNDDGVDTWEVVIVKPDGTALDKVDDLAFPDDSIPAIAVPVDPLDFNQRGDYSYQVIRTTGGAAVRSDVETFSVLPSLPTSLIVSAPTSPLENFFPIFDEFGGIATSLLEVSGGILVYDGVPVIGAISDGDKGDVTVTSGVWVIDPGAVSNSKFRDSAAVSVVGRSANSSGSVADIAAASDGQFLKRTGNALVFEVIAESELPTGIDAAKLADGTISNAEFQYLNGTTSAIQDQLDGKQASLGFTPENAANKDVSGGYVGLTLRKIKFLNVLGTFISFFTNANTAARTYSFQDRDGTIADDTDIAGRVPVTRTVNGHALSSNVSVTKADVNLGSADDTSDANKPVSTAAQAALDLKANLASPALSGSPTAPNVTAGDASTKLANTNFVATAIANLIASSPGALDTLNELAAALGNDPNFATTIATSLGTKEATANKDASGGYAGLTLFKINFKNVANTFTSFFTNVNTAARTYTFQDRNGTIADDTDITAAKARANHTGTQLAATVSDFNAAALLAAPAETTTTTGALLAGATSKTTPVDADYLGLMDSAASNVLKKLSWANLKLAIKAYADPIYAAITHTHAEADVTGLVSDLAAKEVSANKDVSGGYVGKTAHKINFTNTAATFVSFFINANTAVRNYTFPDKDGTVAMLSDLSGGTETVTTMGALVDGAVAKTTPVGADELMLIDSAASFVAKKLTFTNLNTYLATIYQAALGYTAENVATKDATGGYAGLTLFKINFKNAANTFTSFFTNANTAARTYTFADRNGTIADDSDITAAKARANHTGTQLAATVSDFNAAALLAAPAETTTTEGAIISGATSKTTPVDADYVGLMDSAASNILKKLSWANLKATSKTYTDTLYQPLHAALTSISGLSPSNDDIIQRKAGSWTNRTMAQLKADLVLTSADVSLGNVTNVAQLPLSYLDTDTSLAANSDAKVASQKAVKAYIDAGMQGLAPKLSVRAATTANITLSGAQTIDGISAVAGDRVLVKNQTTASANGLYLVASGSWTRTTDADTSAKVPNNMFVFVSEGTTNADSGWTLTNDGAIVLGTTALTFTQFSGAGQITDGAALTKTGNVLDVNVDGSTIEVSSDALRLKDAGTTLAKMANMATASLIYRRTAGTGVPEVQTLAQLKTDLLLTGTNSGDETTTTIGALINGATSKSTPVDADYMELMDSAASNILKKLSWANVKATLKTYNDGLYQPLATSLTTLAGLTATTGNFIISVGSAWASQTPSQARTALGLVIGTDVQAYNSNLTTWAGKTAPSGTVLGTSDTQTVSNKKWTSRVGTTTSSATPTINTDNVDRYILTAQTADITSFTTNLSGTPSEGDTLWITIVGTAARAITWGSKFEASTTALPTTTVTTAQLDVGFVWNTVTSKWRCVASV